MRTGFSELLTVHQYIVPERNQQNSMLKVFMNNENLHNHIKRHNDLNLKDKKLIGIFFDFLRCREKVHNT